MMKLSNNNEGFIILSVNCTWLFHNPVHVYGAITQKGDSVVEVFSTPTFDEARLLVNQKYPQNHYAIPLFNGFQPVSIPVAGEFAVERPDKIECDSNLWSDMRIWREKSPCFETSVKEFADASTGFWGITFAQGFALETITENVVSRLASSEFLYTHAKYFTNIYAANAWMRWDYVNRFYRRYDARTTQITLPANYLEPGAQFRDVHFEQREADRIFSRELTALLEWGLL